jgi:hypothetical protein
MIDRKPAKFTPVTKANYNARTTSALMVSGDAYPRQDSRT